MTSMAPLVILLAWLDCAVGMTTISATNETAVSADRCLSEPACTCVQPSIAKCFCPSDGYSLRFLFGQLDTPFDLLQIGACRQLTIVGQPFSPHPPEFVQIFDSDSVFHDPSFAASLPVTPLPVTPYPALVSAARPIRRIEFLNVTIGYLALSDFYALNRVEQLIIQNSTVKVLGGRPPGAADQSNVGSVQLLSSLFVEVRKGALDIRGLDSFLLTNSTVHAWRSGAVRLLTNADARVVIVGCDVRRMESAALSLLTSGQPAELLVEGSRFERLADDAFRLPDAGQADVRFRGNRLDDVRPRALAALLTTGSSLFQDNVFGCPQPLCWGQDFRLDESNRCWTPVNGSDLAVNLTALPPTDEACRTPADQWSVTLEGAGAGAPGGQLVVSSMAVIAAWALVNVFGL